MSVYRVLKAYTHAYRELGVSIHHDTRIFIAWNIFTHCFNIWVVRICILSIWSVHAHIVSVRCVHAHIVSVRCVHAHIVSVRCVHIREYGAFEVEFYLLKVRTFFNLISNHSHLYRILKKRTFTLKKVVANICCLLHKIFFKRLYFDHRRYTLRK